jgi:hypothetical protein
MSTVKELSSTVAALTKAIEALTTKCNAQSETITLLVAKNTELEARVNALETNAPNVAHSILGDEKAWNVVAGKNIKKTQMQVDIINTAAKETQERHRREKNVVIFGLKISTKVTTEERKIDDETELNNVLDAIGFEKAKAIKTYRLKSRDPTRPAPLVVELNTTSDRNILLKAAMTNRSNIKDIYINPDLTEAERNLSFQLRAERKALTAKLEPTAPFYWGIRNDKVVKIPKTAK